MAEEDLDFSDFDGVEELDWSNVEDELKENSKMPDSEAKKKKEAGGADQFEEGVSALGNKESFAPINGEIDLDFLMHLPLKLSVKIGQKKMLISNLLKINIDDIVELNKKIGEPLDILINNNLVARGEVIVQNEKFGIKVVEIVDKQTRLSTIHSSVS